MAAVFCVAARVSYSLLFTAGNVLVERVFGMVQSKTLIFLFYFLALLVMAVPGIAACVAVVILLPALEVSGGLLAHGGGERPHRRAGAVAVPEFVAVRRAEQPVSFPQNAKGPAGACPRGFFYVLLHGGAVPPALVLPL